jgi:hypothetical protein
MAPALPCAMPSHLPHSPQPTHSTHLSPLFLGPPPPSLCRSGLQGDAASPLVTTDLALNSYYTTRRLPIDRILVGAAGCELGCGRCAVLRVLCCGVLNSCALFPG